MKTKLYLYITNADEYLQGDYEWSLNVSSRKDIKAGGWILAGRCGDFDIDVDNKEIMQSALESIERTEKETRAEFEVKMGLLKEKKANLLSITHQPLEVV